MTPDLKFLFFVGYVDPFSEDRLAVLGFFLNFVRRRRRRRRRRRNGQILDLLGFAAGKKRFQMVKGININLTQPWTQYYK